MMITGSNPCYPNGPQNLPIYSNHVSEQVVMDANSSSSSASTHPSSFLYNLSVLKDKVHQVQSLASIFMSPDHGESTAIAVPTMSTLIQEIIVTASSMMFACQQMSLGPAFDVHHHRRDNKMPAEERGHPSAAFFPAQHDAVDNWYAGTGYNNCNSSSGNNIPHVMIEDNSCSSRKESILPRKSERNGGEAATSFDIIEVEAADLLAKYTHYCQVCGKGFKRDANLRMHMRAHGDEYKSSAALSNPMKSGEAEAEAEAKAKAARKYSCPQEGCRWNKKHARFQPLKSMICVKNHYKRSHCPKMYVCKRCNRKQFSVLSDLRTHEKHCGDLKWQCSCGTTFSRKDKLMGHVALFLGHAPAINGLAKVNANT